MNEKYAEAVKEVKTAIFKSQSRAALHSNAEMLSLYYHIGGYVSANCREGRWGCSAIEEISDRLREEMPGLRGFSAGKIRVMRQFYEEWQPYLQGWAENCSDSTPSAAARDMEQAKTDLVISSGIETVTSAEMPLKAFTAISFSHHLEILHKTKDLDERLFYIRACALGHWSLSALKNRMQKDLYRHQGANINDFSGSMSDEEQYKDAVMMFKDEYFLDFINTEELDLSDPQDVNERVLDNDIIDRIRNFVQSLGSGFCFVGNQHRIEVSGQEYFADLLFYQRDLKALMVIQLKNGEFKPGYLGYLNFYLAALDDMERKDGENPSIGLLLCREANRSIVELAIRSFARPMGVATYSMAEDLPESYKVLAPILEEVPRMLDKAGLPASSQ